MLEAADIAAMIDHTLLKAEARLQDIEELCRQAQKYGFWSVCVNPGYVAAAKSYLKGSNVKVATVVGFPLGANVTETKVYEGTRAIADGADELDMVIDIGAVKSGDLSKVEREIGAIREISRDYLLKVILETCYLTEDEKALVCRIAKDYSVDFVKTSTGFGTKGATVEDVSFLRKMVGQGIGVKASGGIRDLKTLRAMVDAGANRIGTSSGVRIMQEIQGL
jgi:deoxyribose-phosphate aldolase